MKALRWFRNGDILIITDNDDGRWVFASGPAFPNGVSGLPHPHDAAVFIRTDLNTLSMWDEPTADWVSVGGGGGGGPHAADHENGGSDEISVAGLSGLLADPQTAAAHMASHQPGGADYLVSLILSPAQITGTVDDYAPGDGDVWRVTTDASQDITGIAAGADGQRLRVANVGAFDVRLMHQNTGSAAANRLICAGAATITLTPNAEAEGWYDGVTLRWRLALV